MQRKSNCNIRIPKGNLASLTWYEADEKLLEAEKIAMEKYFPLFKLDKLEDGRLFWYGTIMPELIGNTEWNLRLVYCNNYSNDSYGGLIRVYCEKPKLNELAATFLSTYNKILPHLDIDKEGNRCIDIFRRVDDRTPLSATIYITRIIRWITVYELFISGEANYEEFEK